jgi:hypothetical protein
VASPAPTAPTASSLRMLRFSGSGRRVLFCVRTGVWVPGVCVAPHDSAASAERGATRADSSAAAAALRRVASHASTETTRASTEAAASRPALPFIATLQPALHWQ